MKFQVATKLLLNEVSHISKVTNAKSPILLHTSINMILKNNTLILQATDLDHHLVSEISVEGAEDGNVVIKIKDFMELLKRINDKNITIYLINNTLEIIGEKSKFDFFILKENFPSLEIDEFQRIFSISHKQFLTLFDFVSVTTDEWTFNIKLTPNLIEVIASDKKRLIYSTIPSESQENRSYFLSYKSINIILKSICDNIEIYERNYQIFFKLGHICLVVKLLKNNLMMDYQRIIKKMEEGTKITVNTNDFLHLLNRIVVLASIISQVVRIMFNENIICVQSNDISRGKAEENIDVINGICNGTISINCNFLISSIKTFKHTNFDIIYTGSLSHFYLKNDNIIHVIMPIRVM